jgi:hypothetical protein
MGKVAGAVPAPLMEDRANILDLDRAVAAMLRSVYIYIYIYIYIKQHELYAYSAPLMEDWANIRPG